MTFSDNEINTCKTVISKKAITILAKMLRWPNSKPHPIKNTTYASGTPTSNRQL